MNGSSPPYRLTTVKTHVASVFYRCRINSFEFVDGVDGVNVRVHFRRQKPGHRSSPLSLHTTLLTTYCLLSEIFTCVVHRSQPSVTVLRCLDLR